MKNILGKTFWYYLKTAVIFYIYLILTMIIAISIASIGDDLVWLKYILWVLNIALFLFIMFIICSKNGEDAFKLKHTNDIKRRVIMETGDYYEFDTIKEYGKWKGAYIGIYVSAPLIIMILIKLILDICGTPSTSIDAVIAFTYGTFFLPLRGSDVGVSAYFSLYAAVVLILTSGIAYYLGARRIIKQTEKIRQTNEQIYGKRQ